MNLNKDDSVFSLGLIFPFLLKENFFPLPCIEDIRKEVRKLYDWNVYERANLYNNTNKKYIEHYHKIPVLMELLDNESDKYRNERRNFFKCIGEDNDLLKMLGLNSNDFNGNHIGILSAAISDYYFFFDLENYKKV